MHNITKPISDVRIATMLPNTWLGKLLKVISPLLDRLLGIHKLRQLYLSCALPGDDKQAFTSKILNALGVKVAGGDGMVSKIPKTGSCIVVCNHPYGMIEGIIIANVLTAYRSDTKVMANVGLQIFKEIKSYFIFVNPLKPKAVMNTSALKQCFKHLNNDGLLVIFPAGRVSFYQKEQQRIADGEWDRVAAQLAIKTNTPILPVFISGSNSALFHNMGRLYYRFRLMMLVREMFKLQQHTIHLSAGNLIKAEQLKGMGDTPRINSFLRLQCYLNDDTYITPWLADNKPAVFAEIIEPADKAALTSELEKLPEKQRLLTFKSFTVYYGYQHQIPLCVQDITRLREITFRTLNEGSGESCDTDKYDATYLHLFIFDNKNEEIIGAYRIGQTDVLLKAGDPSSLYLSQMFTFEAEFINQQQPCLEMGRSFIVESHQNSFYGLLLLWKGIGAFVCQNPRYRTLYGTVSLSKVYDPRSVALINEVMVTDNNGVKANTAFAGQLHPEVKANLQAESLNIDWLSALVMGIETDGKDLPVLVKQYHKLGATFHCTGIDANFNHTPGLLLSVNLAKAPDKLLKLYLGASRENYIQYNRH